VEVITNYLRTTWLWSECGYKAGRMVDFASLTTARAFSPLFHTAIRIYWPLWVTMTPRLASSGISILIRQS